MKKLQSKQSNTESKIISNASCTLKRESIFTFIKHKQEQLCLICFNFCYHYTYEEGDQINQQSESNQSGECQCKRHLTRQQMKNEIKLLLETISKHANKSYTLEYIRQNSLLEEIFRADITKALFQTENYLIQQDMIRFRTLKGDMFNWEEMTVEEIMNRTALLKFLRLNQYPLSQLHNSYAQYCLKVLEKPFAQPAQDNYNAVVAFQTTAMNLISHTYFAEMFYNLETIDISTLGSVNFIARVRIRERNLAKVQRQFGDRRKLMFNSIIQWIDNYILDDTSQLWIRSHEDIVHRTYYYPIRMAKDMIIHGLISDEAELRALKDKLYSKITKFLTVELLVESISQNEIKKLNPKYLQQVTKYLMEIRQFYMEMLYHFFFLQNDFELIAMVKDKEYQIQTLKTFEEEFSQKMLEIYMKYVLQPRVIRGVDLIYGDHKQTIGLIIRKFLPMVKNTEDEYLQSLWLTKQRDIDHYLTVKSRQYSKTSKFKDVQIVANSIEAHIKKYFKQNEYLYTQQILIYKLNQELAEFVEQLEINQKLEKIKSGTYNKQQLYQQQMIMGESNLLYNLIKFLNYFLWSEEIAEKSNQVKYLKQNIFTIFQYAYYKNNVNISCFVQKSNLEKLEKGFPKELFELLDFAFFNNWIAFTSKGLLSFAKTYWNSQFKFLQQKYLDDQASKNIYESLTKILAFIQRWNDPEHEKVLKYLSSSDLQISKQLVNYIEQPILSKARFQRAFQLTQNQKPYQKQEFYLKYLQCLNNFIGKRYEFAVFTKLRKVFTVEYIYSTLKIANNSRSRLILMNLLEFLYIDIKCNLLDQRDHANIKASRAKCPLYTDVLLTKQQYHHITRIISMQFERFLNSLQNNRQVAHQFQESYVMNAIFSPYFRLTFYLSRIPDQQEEEQYLKACKQQIEQLMNLTIKFQDLKFKYINSYSPRQVAFSFREKIEQEVKEQEVKSKNDLEIPKLCQIMSKYIQQFFDQGNINILKFNTFIETDIDTKDTNTLLMSKFKRQYLYSNKMDVRMVQKSSPLIKYKSASDINRNSDSYINNLQNSYEDFKMSLTSTQTKKNYYLSKMSASNKDDKKLIYNLCRFFVHELRKPITFKDRNAFYNILQCLCNILFVAPHNIQKILFKLSKDNDGKIDWIYSTWQEMLRTNLFIRFKNHQNSIWVDQYIRFWIIVKFLHFLIEENNQYWKKYLSNCIFGNDDRDMIYRVSTMIAYISKESQWHQGYEQENLDDLDSSNNQHLILVCSSLYDLLNQISTGPYLQAQLSIYQSLIMQENGILKRYIKNYNSKFYELKEKAVDFLLHVTQGRNRTICKYITENYSVSSLNLVMINSIKQLFCQYQSEKNGIDIEPLYITHYKLELSDISELYKNYATSKEFANHHLLNVAFKIFTYLENIKRVSIKCRAFYQQRLKKINDETYKPIGQQEIAQYVTYKFLYRISSSIEYLEDDKVQTLAFKIPGKCMYLTKETKNSFIDNVNRSSPQDKISDLIKSFKYFNMEMKYYEDRYSNHFNFFRQGIQNLPEMELVLYLIAIGLNIVMLYDLTTQNATNVSVLPSYNAYITLGYILVILSGFTWLIWLSSRLRINYRIQIAKAQQLLPMQDDQLRNYTKIYIFLKILLLDPDSLVLYFHVMFCLLGINYNVWFFSVQLLAIVNRVKTLKYIISALTIHIDMIALAYCLQVLVVFCYAFISQISFQGRFLWAQMLDGSNNQTYQQFCSNFIHCWTNLLNQAQTSNNGIGSIMGLQSYSQRNWSNYYGRFFVDVTFFIFVNIVFLNIIQGIIVDTFDELRGKSQQQELDRNNVCFICSKDRDYFISKGESFKNHIQVKHSIWNYVNFLVYLSQKDEKDCDGIETKLKLMLKEEDSSWVPIKSKEDEEQQQVEQKKKKKEVEKIITTLTGLLDEHEKQINEYSKHK